MSQPNPDPTRDDALNRPVAEYLAAVERGESPDRDALLAAHPDLADRLRAFFADHDRLRGLAGSPPAAGLDDPAEDDLAGTVVAGRYKLLQRIGEGGMGTVYMAEQTAPVRRRVAVKLVKPGMDSRAVLARFEAERQALALMDHPNIARVLDGGTTADARPYFVMELVKGLPLTRYCDDKRLTVPRRLELFRQVCAAVQHAHMKGVIHRDLKPSNVLVTEHDGTPVPKVIDFGLAKAMAGPGVLTDKTLFTAFGAAVGTPPYMAPEQVGVNALDVDTRTDVYALGVMLYELLTGTTPVERRRLAVAAWDEVRRLIREEEPPRPSARLSSSDALPSIAACRGTEPARLGRLVRGDLDWVVMKALEKDRARRYESAGALAEDLRRHLADEPVAAGPPALGYRLRKLVRRNRAAAAAAAVLGLAVLLALGGLGGGLVWSLWASERASEAERQARAALEEVDGRRREAERREAAAALEHDLRFCADGKREVGLLRLARTIRGLPDHCPDLRQAAVMNLLAWGQDVAPLIRPPALGRSAGPAPALSPDGRTVLTSAGGPGGPVRLWDALTGRPRATLEASLPDSDYPRCDFLPDGGTVFTVEADRAVRLWDAADGSPRARLAGDFSPGWFHLTGSRGAGRVLTFGRAAPDPEVKEAGKFNPPSLAEERQEVRLWDGATGRLVARSECDLPDVLRGAAFSPDGAVVVAATGRQTASVYAADDGRLIRRLSCEPGENLQGFAFTPDGTRLALLTQRLIGGLPGATVRWWRTADWQPDGPPALLSGAYESIRPANNGWCLVESRGSSANGFVGRGELAVLRHGAANPLTELAGDRLDAKLDGGYRPPSGRRYHPDLAGAAVHGRFLCGAGRLLDVHTETLIGPANGWVPVSDPSVAFVGLGGRGPEAAGPGRSLALLPPPALDLPADRLELWAQVVARGELTPAGQFRKWDEPTWERKRRDLAAAAPAGGAFPFPGAVATDRAYWLREELAEVGDRPEALALLDRLIAAEPNRWIHYVNRGLVLSQQGRHGDASADVRTVLRLLGRDPEGGVPDLGGLGFRLACTPGQPVESYAALHRAVEGDGVKVDHREATRAVVRYRLGDYSWAGSQAPPDGPEGLAFLVGGTLAACPPPTPAAVAGALARLELTTPAIPKSRHIYQWETVLRAMCLHRLGDTARARYELRVVLARMREVRNLPEEFDPLIREAVALIDPKP